LSQVSALVLRDLFQQNITNFLTPEAEFMNVQFRWGFCLLS
jgi:hypothetical protein